MENKKDKILVALSGGVDSAASVLCLMRQNWDVSCVYFDMLGDLELKKEAQKMADSLGVTLLVEDLREEFKEKILETFVAEYKAGRTPNPCTLCNKEIKFSQLLKVADNLGIKHVATGHYACVEKEGKNFILKKAIDLKKDQSYFLYRLGQRELSRIILPLCGLMKGAVKEIVRAAGVSVPSKESQDICFIKKEQTLKEFLSTDIKEQEGEIVTESGNSIGMHKGVSFYTIGQRRGLDVNGGPFYVSAKDIQKNKLIVTREKDSRKLNPRKVFFKDATWVKDRPSSDLIYKVRTRYLAQEAEVKIEEQREDSFVANLLGDQWAVAPGQAIVVFDGDRILGGGVIDSTQ